MKKIILSLAVLSMAFVSNAQQDITHSASTDIVAGSVACQGGGITSDNVYYRAFNLNDFGITTDWEVINVQLGWESLTVGPDGYPAVITIWENDPAFPFPNTSPTVVAEIPVTLTGDMAGTLVDFEISGAVVSAGSELIVSIGWESDIIDDGGNGVAQVFIGSNAAGQTAPTYLSSNGCGINTPSDVTDIGFPNMHLIMTVTGQEPLSVDDNLAELVSIYPVPATDVLNVKVPSSIEVTEVTLHDLLGRNTGAVYSNGTINVSNLNRGVYMLTVKTTEGTLTQKVIKK